MARPIKKGFDYFNLDVNFYADRKIKTLRSRYGYDGISVYQYLLCQIYGGEGYYIKLDDEYYEYIADEMAMSEEKIRQIISHLCKRSLFEGKLFTSVNVLTSRSIQLRFQEMCSTRGAKRIIWVEPELWLLDEADTHSFIKMRINDDKSKINYGFSQKKPPLIQEKPPKVNKSKVNKSKVNNNSNCDDWLSKFEDSFARPLTQIELTKLSDALHEFGEDMLLFALEIAVTSNAINIRYIEGILNKWRTNNIYTIEKARLDSKSHQGKRQFQYGSNQVRQTVLPKDFDENKNRNISTEQISEKELFELKARMRNLEKKK